MNNFRGRMWASTRCVGKRPPYSMSGGDKCAMVVGAGDFMPTLVDHDEAAFAVAQPTQPRGFPWFELVIGTPDMHRRDINAAPSIRQLRRIVACVDEWPSSRDKDSAADSLSRLIGCHELLVHQDCSG
ncbi:MAG: hypothetical protein Q9221_008101 [Calogaya cf. arnoldii]